MNLQIKTDKKAVKIACTAVFHEEIVLTLSHPADTNNAVETHHLSLKKLIFTKVIYGTIK